MLDKLLLLSHGITIGFFGCSSYYFTKLRGGIANRLQYILGLFMFLWFVQSLKDILLYLPIIENNQILINMLLIMDITSVAPCMFLCLELVKPGWCTWTKLLIYELPFIVLIVLYSIVGCMMGQATWGRYLLLTSLIYSLVFTIYNIIVVIINSKRFNKQLRNTYSYTDNLDIRWMRGVLVIFLLFAILWTCSVYYNGVLANITYYIFSIVFWSIIFFFINKQQNAIYLASNYEQNETTENSEPDESVDELLKKWNAAMIDNQMFLNPHLTLVDMAVAIGTNRSNLSRFVNNHFGVSFLDYVNALRIDYAVPLLHKPNAKVSAISSISGFNSQNTFYRYFKNRFGCTPGEYINNLKL